MKKLLALLLCGIMLAVPMASLAETEDTDLSAFSFAVSDLVVNYNGMELDFTGLTSSNTYVSRPPWKSTPWWKAPRGPSSCLTRTPIPWNPPCPWTSLPSSSRSRSR